MKANAISPEPAQAPEEWRAVVGYEGLYEVSSAGRVRRLIYRNGYGYFLLPRPRLLSPRPNRAGYLMITLTMDNSSRWPWVSVLVCEAFHGPRPSPAHEAAHRDGTRTNNRATNLYWATPADQVADKRRHGTVLMGECCPQARLTEGEVRDIRARATLGAATLASLYGVTSNNIWLILNRRTWKHV
jgi:hypothetical protein